jgi:nicotinamidase/pyrazinamidase
VKKYEQMMWPEHCTQGSPGAEFMVPPVGGEHIQQKGMKLLYDSYSAFMDAEEQDTGLSGSARAPYVKRRTIFAAR